MCHASVHALSESRTYANRMPVLDMRQALQEPFPSARRCRRGNRTNGLAWQRVVRDAATTGCVRWGCARVYVTVCERDAPKRGYSLARLQPYGERRLDSPGGSAKISAMTSSLGSIFARARSSVGIASGCAPLRETDTVGVIVT